MSIQKQFCFYFSGRNLERAEQSTSRGTKAINKSIGEPKVGHPKLKRIPERRIRM